MYITSAAIKTYLHCNRSFCAYLSPIQPYPCGITKCYYIRTPQDIDMYYDATDTPAMARTSNLNEELGQVCKY